MSMPSETVHPDEKDVAENKETRKPEKKEVKKPNPFLDSMDPLEIGVRRIRRSVVVKTPNKPDRQMFLQEMSGFEQTEYSKLLEQIAIKDENGKFKEWKGVAELESALLSQALWEVAENGDETLVPFDELMHWPVKIRENLHDAAEKLCDLDALAQVRVKND